MRTRISSASLFIVAFAAIAQFSAGPARAQDAASPVAAADNSLTTAQYIAAGMPAIDKPWTLDQYDAVTAALQSVAKDDPTHLPRFMSPKSGDVFDRMISQENLKSFYDKSIPVADRLQAFGGLTKFLAIVTMYSDASKPNAALDIELLKLGGFILRAELAACLASDEFVAAHPEAKNDPKTADGLNQVKAGSAQSAGGVVDIIVAHTEVRMIASVAFMPEFKEVMKALLPELQPDAQDAFRKRIIAELGKETDPFLKSEWRDMADSYPRTPNTGFPF
jgi:hypothetical protein